jgi:hypothetical protein
MSHSPIGLPVFKPVFDPGTTRTRIRDPKYSSMAFEKNIRIQEIQRAVEN